MDTEDVIYMYTMTYYLVIKNEIWPFVTTWMDSEGPNTVWHHLYMDFLKVKPTSEYNKKEKDSQI